MEQRLKELRRTLGLNTRIFGARIGMSNSSISLLESGKRQFTERTVKDICREFSVNEEWFRTGNGEMFGAATREKEIAMITASLMRNDDPFRTEITKIISEMDSEQLEELKEITVRLYEAIKKA